MSRPADGRVKYIACQGEANGFGQQAFESYISGLGQDGEGYRPVPRGTTEQALSALLSQDVERAVVPLHSQAEGYFLETLALLSEFKDLQVVAEVQPDNQAYCLAAPRVQMQELTEAGFSAKLGHKGPEGWLLPWRDQSAFKDRIDIIYATPEAERRCAMKLATFRGAGVDVKTPETSAEPAREVLALARDAIDEDRELRTLADSNGGLKVETRIKAKAQARPLYAALLPREVVSRFKDDYVLIDSEMEDQTEGKTRFLVVERKEAKSGDKTKKTPPLAKGLAEQVDDIINRNRTARMMVKVETRGDQATSASDIFKTLEKSGVAFAPVFLHRQSASMPALFELEWTPDESRFGGAAGKVIRDLTGGGFGGARVLGVYEASSAAFDHEAFKAQGGGLGEWIARGAGWAALVVIGDLVGANWGPLMQWLAGLV